MILISYDIADNKLRTKFSKYIQRFGHRLQYSVYEIDNGPRILDSIMSDLENTWEKRFSETDSVLIFHTSKTCKVIKYGYAKHDDEAVIIV
ncbi:MAG: CRISPR-associated endonuclease Cas2 [Eggerthellaceae bacterium]|nr:CRISPR-associated endonuclease Cas2 [Eggerthellaceae bacterium]